MEEATDLQRGEPGWATLTDAQLLQMRIGDLRVRIEGSEIEPRTQELSRELAERNLRIRPACYLGDEWFSPEGSPRSQFRSIWLIHV